MNILGLSTSPRPGGNTDILLDEFLKTAADNGCATEKIRTGQLVIRHCAHCDHCRTYLKCPIDDDMQIIYPKLIETNCLVLASPLYFMAPCAQAKLIIDRCQLFWSQRDELQKRVIPPEEADRPKRRGIFISVGGSRGKNIFEGAEITMKWFFEALEMEYFGSLLYDDCDQHGVIRNHPTALEDARNLANQLLSPPLK